ncbi:MAG: hypothetical protein A3G02_00925 [Candidatus Yanofskybacteria bacterium RIFCSPLOWO2_12_FULL_44_13b]|uniref:POTRA domain-containing protein n=2 Tax=Parcubacteria group TaxID=1794811 RepID=A0A0G0XJY3_9BACT|nr:MAG: hypothetical protein UU85_C0005G0004 [Candidatus Wolfebacteria bacterium GW2011_GWA2_42_10]OGN03568.1 MAG: hypothetical protein A2657_00620 [Candidatus Yanofskybacteria bacterium RIFCSPHIGHO2_01_FULL_44_110b]OGN14114.1 MAG: hypothetical protein A3C01_00770 [Candidatus Yanofskybacteria bacterium RIFCSPHIGHO2_02_FULL_44_36b]OGN19281.1 MAG: hypothetical protein A3F50_03230 [Candidatus Yanofskybacteria bacterium RIFCSPHIGHO2_12_FULL_44_29b]OGN27020.1 MAG: hypothetical protein A3B12_00860 [C
MRAVDIKSGYHDKLAMRRRRAFIIKISAIIFLVIALISLTLYLIFFSSYLKITNVSANQTSAIGSGEIVSAAHEYMDKSVLYIPTQRNIFFFNSDNFNKYLLSKYPMIKSINTEKKYPHNLEITISERTPVGIWCFRDDGCVYFDREMNVWGAPNQTSGYVLLSVDDEKRDAIEKEYFEAILRISENMPKSINIKRILIADKSVNDMFIYTNKNYYIKISTESDIESQFKIFEAFLRSNDAENIEYIDLRINGRIYYK